MKKKFINQIHTDVSFKPKDIIGLMNVFRKCYMVWPFCFSFKNRR
ncbi:Uncharacterised protein [Streptococcus pneumoniae]|nr:Uncharacterised protein [Streptococcus pneumoniae]